LARKKWRIRCISPFIGSLEFTSYPCPVWSTPQWVRESEDCLGAACQSGSARATHLGKLTSREHGLPTLDLDWANT
jgi:hypothetical protein